MFGFGNTRTCVGCGHVVTKSRTYPVVVFPSGFGYSMGAKPVTEWYCGACRKPYDSRDMHGEFYKKICVNENGEPVGYTRTPSAAQLASEFASVVATPTTGDSTFVGPI